MMISVIIPVYNSEKYLNKCVDSVVSQTFSDYEIILVDDGSTDDSCRICDQYNKAHDNIVVLHQKNGGPSVARNEASKMARGEYITFIDSDDYVTNDYLETLYSGLILNDADISSVLMTEITEEEKPNIRNKSLDVFVMTGREALLDVLYQKNLDTTPCGMLFKRQIVLDNPFPIGRYHEDDFTMFKYFESAVKVVICKQIKYFYVQHESSIMHVKSDKIMMDEIDASENLVKYFSRADYNLQRAAESKKFSNYCQILGKYKNLKKYHPEIYSNISTFLHDSKWGILKNKECRVKNRIAALILILGENAFLIAGRIASKIL